MNKLITTDIGGFDLVSDDLRFLDAAYRDAFKGLTSTFISSNDDVYILKGCQRTLVGSTVNLSAGYVVYGGEIISVPAHSFPLALSQTEVWCIETAFDSAGLKLFKNQTTHETYEIRVAKVKNVASVTSEKVYAQTKTLLKHINDSINTVPSGVILLWGGLVANIPTGYVLCDGTNGTPDLRNKFIVGAGDTYAVADEGGQNEFTIGLSNLPEHSHTITDNGHSHGTDSYIKSGDGFVNGNDDGSGALQGNSSSSGTASSNSNISIDNGGGVPNPTAIDNRPLYYALAYIQKV